VLSVIPTYVEKIHTQICGCRCRYVETFCCITLFSYKLVVFIHETPAKKDRHREKWEIAGPDMNYMQLMLSYIT